VGGSLQIELALPLHVGKRQDVSPDGPGRWTVGSMVVRHHQLKGTVVPVAIDAEALSTWRATTGSPARASRSTCSWPSSAGDGRVRSER